MGRDRFSKDICIIVLLAQFLQDRTEIALRQRPLIGSACACARLQNRLKCGCGLFEGGCIIAAAFGQRVEFERGGCR
jgi:hypothetical protein